MEKWSQNWLIRFKPHKCCYMRMGSQVMQKFEYKLGEKLHEVEAEKDLGVIIDRKLTLRT